MAENVDNGISAEKNKKFGIRRLAGQLWAGQAFLGAPNIKSEVFEEFVSFFADASIPIMVMDGDEHIVFWNRGCEQKLQWTMKEALGKPWRSLLSTEFPDGYGAVFERIVSFGSWEGELLLKCRDGSDIGMAVSLVLRRDDRSQPIAMLMVGRQLSEEKCRHLVDNELVGVFRTTKDGRLMYLNKALSSIFGFDSVEDMLASQACDKRYADPQRRRELVEKLQRDGRADNFEFTALKKDGTRLELIMNAVLKEDEIRGTIIDITGRKEIEKRLIESERRYRELMEVLPDGVGVNIGNRIAYINPAGAALLGSTVGELTGRSVFDFIPERLHEQMGRRMEQVLGEGLKGVTRDETFRLADGREAVIELSASPIRFNGETGIQIIFRDVTGRKMAEREREMAVSTLRHDQELLRGLLDHLPVMLFAIDAGGTIVLWNKECERVTGYTAGEIVGNTGAFSLLCRDTRRRRRFVEKWNNNRVFFRDWEWQITAKDGSGRMISWSDISGTYPIPGWRTWALGVDITERKTAEDKLQVAHRQLLDMIDFLPEPTFVINREKKIIAWNQQMEELTGVIKADVIGKGDHCYAVPFYGKACPILIDMLGWDLQKITAEYGPVEKDGQTLYVERFIPLINRGKGAFLQMKATPLFDENGEIVGGIETIRDISQQKENEAILKKDKNSFEKLLRERTRQLLKAQNELADSRHLSEIGVLAATVAHELRNPLAAIRMGAYNIRRKMQGELPIKEHIETIEKKILESDQIISNLLNYSRIKTPMREFVSLSDILEDAVASVRPRFFDWPVDVEVRNDCRDLRVYVDPQQIKEILVNILSNAYEALPEKKGRITVRAKRTGSVFGISVSDTGTGIVAENIGKIARPFFTTKSKGTGLGLAVSNQMVAMHGGKIKFKSRPGEGTTVLLSLPLKKGTD
ncbi:MAG: PAS domain S-box protein [Deltaproteobacteria bacterium]